MVEVARASVSIPLARGCGVDMDRRWRLREGARRGTLPRLSGDQTRQAVEGEAEDRLIGGARRQVDLDLGFQLDDAGGDLDAGAVARCRTA